MTLSRSPLTRRFAPTSPSRGEVIRIKHTMQILYTIIIYLLAPLALLRLWLRGRKDPAYRLRWAERFGFYADKKIPAKAVWVHAVSVGETIAAIPLIKDLLAKGYPVVLTNMTITGSQRAQALFGDKVIHYYLPYDLSGAVQRFYKHVQPQLGIIMETEIWPNLYIYAEKNKIPLILANARLSEKSMKHYAYFPGLFRPALNRLTHIAAQGQKDAERFIQLGAPSERVSVMGNIKFALEVPQTARDNGKLLREKMHDRPVLVAASTHSGEEEQVLQAFRAVQQEIPNALLILVPRHPERFDQVAELLTREHFTFTRRSQKDETALANVNVFLGDTMGEMLMFYAAADLAFVGGSLIPIGGHNVLEPAALSVPSITGPHTFNFTEIMQLMTTAHACLQVQTAQQLGEVVIDLLNDSAKRQQMGEAAYNVVLANRDAPKKLAIVLEKHLQNNISA
jgi:3-deoxy-D-manno-octulosonic-acid transferase